MRITRIYQSGTYQIGDLVELSAEATQHVAVVLRMQPGDKLYLFCGDNREFEACIQTIKKKQVLVSVINVKEINRESPLTIHLAQAISKGERMEMVMQKSVELGVASITPLITERCVVKLDQERMEKKMHQWQNIVIGACEQSGRNTVPIIYPPMSFQHYVQKTDAALKLLLHPDGGKTWRDYSLHQADVAVIVGPEGGLSDGEIKCAYEHDFAPLSLGPRILRTETAALTALSILQAVGGDL